MLMDERIVYTSTSSPVPFTSEKYDRFGIMVRVKGRWRRYLNCDYLVKPPPEAFCVVCGHGYSELRESGGMCDECRWDSFVEYAAVVQAECSIDLGVSKGEHWEERAVAMYPSEKERKYEAMMLEE